MRQAALELHQALQRPSPCPAGAGDEHAALLRQEMAADVWTIWITAALTWVLAGFFCTMRNLSWKKKAGRSRTADAVSGDPA